MAIFKENLTSKILQENSLMVLNSFNVEKQSFRNWLWKWQHHETPFKKSKTK